MDGDPGTRAASAVLSASSTRHPATTTTQLYSITIAVQHDAQQGKSDGRVRRVLVFQYSWRAQEVPGWSLASQGGILCLRNSRRPLCLRNSRRPQPFSFARSGSSLVVPAHSAAPSAAATAGLMNTSLSWDDTCVPPQVLAVLPHMAFFVVLFVLMPALVKLCASQGVAEEWKAIGEEDKEDAAKVRS